MKMESEKLRVQILIYRWVSPLQNGVRSLPSPAGKGDRRAVDEESILSQNKN